MITYSKIKGTIAAICLMAVALNSNAQKINEQDLKVKVVEITSPATLLMSLKPVIFQYDLKKYPALRLPAGNQYGFLAVNTRAQFPELVSETSKSYESGKNNNVTAKYEEVQNDKLIPFLVAAMKEQQQEIELLKKQVQQLKNANSK